MSVEQLYKIYIQNPSVQTDTRLLKPGDIFFALKGDNFNGNTFAKKAIDAGASFAVIDEEEAGIPGKTILVNDVLKTLQELAKYHRERFNIPFLAITGSNGKTTTKELVFAVLSSGFKTYATEGNLNNHIGIPLTLLKIKPDAGIAIIEMGANHLKEIESYCVYAQPTHGLITNCGKAHLEGFGSIEGVKKGKGELYDYIRKTNGAAFVMWDYDYLQEMSKGINSIFKYGTKNANIEGKIVRAEPYLAVEITKGAGIGTLHTQLVGLYNFPNVLAAVAIGKHFGITEEKIKTSIENYQPSNSRSQLIKKGSNTIILDAYNANPSSMKLAVENFAAIQAENKVLMLGAMAELGSESINEHKIIVEIIKKTNWKDVVLVGGDFLAFPHPFLALPSSTSAKEWLQQQKFENTHFLIKGSRSMKMEKVLEDL